MKYVDVMDTDRLIEPTDKAQGKATVCRIFFRDGLGVPRYVGTAPVPTGLIGDYGNNRYIGFLAQGDLVR